jgi:nucleotide-binding universal stress UspA family protein
MFHKLLLAVDGSPHADKAVGIADELARALGSEVLVLHVREVEVGRFPGQMEAPQDAIDLVNRVVGRLEADGVVCKGEARSTSHGRAAREIVEEATAAGADGIVLGSRGLSDWEAALIGSVAHKVISLAVCPVIVAR